MYSWCVSTDEQYAQEEVAREKRASCQMTIPAVCGKWTVFNITHISSYRNCPDRRGGLNSVFWRKYHVFNSAHMGQINQDSDVGQNEKYFLHVCIVKSALSW